MLVTWVVTGALAHEDHDGRVRQPAGELAITRTGTGITHSERAEGVATRFVQACLRPGQADDEPVRRTSDPDLGSGDLVVVAGATYRIGDLQAGATVRVPAAPLRYVFVATGALTRSSLAEPLSAGDAFEITVDVDVTVTTAVPTQLLVLSFAG